MTPEQQQEMRAQAVQQALQRRNLTINAASMRLGINRQTITKMSNGLIVDLETVERFARGLRLPINDWRTMWGYEPIMQPEKPPLERVRDTAPDLEYDPDLEGVTIYGHDGSNQIDPHDLEIINRIYRAFLAERRRKQAEEGGETS